MIYILAKLGKNSRTYVNNGFDKSCSAPVGQNRVTPQLVLDPSAPKAGRHTRAPTSPTLQ